MIDYAHLFAYIISCKTQNIDIIILHSFAALNLTTDIQ